MQYIEEQHFQLAHTQIKSLLGNTLHSFRRDTESGLYHILVYQDEILKTSWEWAVEDTVQTYLDVGVSKEMTKFIKLEELDNTFRVSATGPWVLEQIARMAKKHHNKNK